MMTAPPNQTEHPKHPPPTNKALAATYTKNMVLVDFVAATGRHWVLVAAIDDLQFLCLNQVRGSLLAQFREPWLPIPWSKKQEQKRSSLVSDRNKQTTTTMMSTAAPNQAAAALTASPQQTKDRQ
eukprot:jgi/Psemu1/39184/gm1.39184_g